VAAVKILKRIKRMCRFS